MYSAVINSIEVTYHFKAGEQGDYNNAPTDHQVQILSCKIDNADAWAYIDACGDEDEAYEFSSTLASIESLVEAHHVFNR